MAKKKSTGMASLDMPVLVHAEHLISRRLDEMLAFEPYLANPDHVYELHEMRIAAKRLRYTMEIFQDVYTLYTGVGPEFGRALKAVKALQEHLGVLHDADVLVPQLLEHMAHVLHAGYGPQPSAHDKGKSSTKSATAGVPAAKKSKDIQALPIAGVHRVDYLACQGLLNLCTKTRSDRDARYALLVQDWQRLKSELLFDRLRQLIAASTEEEDIDKERPVEAGTLTASEAGSVSDPMPDVQHPDPVALPLTAPDNRPEDTENVEDVSPRKNPQVQRAPGEPGHVAAARRRVPARPDTGTSDAPRKGKEGGRAERGGAETGRGKREAGRDTAPKSGAASAARRNGSARGARHSGPGTDTDTGAGKGGAK